MRRRLTPRALLPFAACLVALAAPAQAQPAPATPDMIQALKPTRQRNLVVRPREPEAPAAAAPAAPAAPPAAEASVAPAVAATATTPVAAPVAAAGPASTASPPSLTLAIAFDPNSARVRPESGPLLGHLVAAMLSPELKSARFLIEGHTDARGSSDANQRLSQQRADEVRLYLVALGVHPSRLRAVGKGSSDPVNPLDPLAPDNRRVRVVTLE
jgi:outer membrane protein OmpA-like peptidoglycan-associated protein